MSGTGSWTWLSAQFKASPRKTGALFLIAALFTAIVVRQLSQGAETLEAALPPIIAPAANGPLQAAMSSSAPARAPMPELPRDAARDLFAADWTLFSPAAQAQANDRSPAATETMLEPTSSWHLTLTLTAVDGQGRPSAVINGRQVGEGDVIEGATVESIAAREVVLSTSRRGRMVLRMD